LNLKKICTGKEKKLCDKNCMICFDRSFASNYDRAICWAADECMPWEISKWSHKKIKFNCTDCDHQFESRLDEITQRNQWCNYCANKKLCEEDCDICYEKSFASHPRKNKWSLENDCEPREVFKSSSKKFKFDCTCGHTFESSLSDITQGNNWCPYCAHQKLCNEGKCQVCFEKSVASLNIVMIANMK
jgi:hypothetical protein